jgi:hypothetical protein
MGKNARTFGQDLMRGEGLTWTGASTEFDHCRIKEGTRETTEASGTSIFDPVLCELVYRWFCPKGGAVLDSFAGGSVRGIVAAKLGLRYTGIDLSKRQIEENRKQAQEICSDNQPAWILGDSRQAAGLAPRFLRVVFSCPPYGNLKIYSDDDRDLSTLSHADFIAAYREII